MKNEMRTAALFAAIFCAPFLTILLCVIFLACSPTATEPAPEFIGKWADASRPPFLFTVEFRADRSVTFQVRDGGDLISRTDGIWTHRAPHLITRDTLCQEGAPLRLIACPAEADTVRPTIEADRWPLSFERDGEIISFDLRRVN